MAGVDLLGAMSVFGWDINEHNDEDEEDRGSISEQVMKCRVTDERQTIQSYFQRRTSSSFRCRCYCTSCVIVPLCF